MEYSSLEKIVCENMVKKERTRTIPVVLRFLALNAPASKYEIAEETDKSYSNVHRDIGVLLSGDFIEVVETKESKKNKNMKVECYKLTSLGLLHALPYVEITQATMDKLTQIYGEVNLAFKYWPKIEDEKARTILLERIQDASRDLKAFLYFRYEYARGTIGKEEAAKSLRDKDKFVFWGHFVTNKSEAQKQKKLLSVIKNFPELRAFVLKYVRFKLGHLQEWETVLSSGKEKKE